MTDIEARARSRSRLRVRGRSSDAERFHSPMSSAERDSFSSYHVPLELAEACDDATAEHLSAHGSDGAAPVDDWSEAPRVLPPPPPTELSAAARERIAAKQYWFDLMLQFRTHVEHLNYLATHASPADDDAAKDLTTQGNDITNEDSFLAITTGYHAHLCRLVSEHPEASVPLWHTFRSLGGRWTTERQLAVRDEAYLVTLPSGGAAPQRWRVDLTREADLRAFRTQLTTPRAAADATLRALVVPDLSPLFIELVGGLLHLDHRVFTNHLWSESRRPFAVANRRVLDARADTTDAPNTATLDIDTDALMYVQSAAGLGPTEKARVRQRLLAFFRHSPVLRQSPTFFPFLDRSFESWPASLATPLDTRHDISTSFHAVSRATVHWIERADSPIQILVLLTPSNRWSIGGSNAYTYQGIDHTVHCRDDNDCFMYKPPLTTDNLHTTPDESDRFCTDWENALAAHAAGHSLEAVCLTWLADKFLRSTIQHTHIDGRRLAAFRSAHDPGAKRQRTTSAATSAAVADADATHDPLRDLQYLRNRVARQQHTAALLQQRLASVPVLGPSAARFTPAALRLAHLQQSISDAQADVSAALQRRLTLLQLEEARKSIAQGAMVRKLTVLAFVFVPVSATSGAFGMNLGPLLANPPPIWAFIVAAIALTALLVALAGADATASTLRGFRATSAAAAGRSRHETLRRQPGERAATLDFRTAATADGAAVPVVPSRSTTTGVLSRRGTPAAGPVRSSSVSPWRVLQMVAYAPLRLIAAVMYLVGLAALPWQLGARVLRHLHAEGAALREREARELDALLRARFAFRESPVRVWWEAWIRGWADAWRRF